MIRLGCWPRACLRGIGRAPLALSQSRLGKPVGVVLGLSWGATGFLLGSVFFGTPGGIVCTVILALLGIGANLGAAELINDLKRN